MTRTKPTHLSVLIAAIIIALALTTATGPAIIGAHAATSTISLTSSGLVASDSLTTGNTAGWTITGNASPGGSVSKENSSGLYLGVKTGLAGDWAGWFAKSANTNALLFHAVLTLPYKTIADNAFNTGLYVQTSSSNFINYVACAAVVSTTGYYWTVVQATGPAVGAVTTTNLWTSPTNTMPLTQDCTIITNGNNYLKVYLGGNVVYKSSTLTLNMPSPFNAYLEVQTNSASAIRFGSYLSYYSTIGENVTVTKAPAGGTVKIVDSLNNLVASAPVSSTGTATLTLGKFRLPLTANIQAYDSTNTLVASTTSPINIWGGDSYAVTPIGTTLPPGQVSAVTQTQSGLDKFDSLATGITPYWTFDGSANNQPGSKTSFSEDSQGLHIGVQSPLSGVWTGFYARSPNTFATLYHLVTRMDYTSMPTGLGFNTGLYVQTWDNTWINYVGCVAQATSSGYNWVVIQSFGPGTGAVTITVLYQSPTNGQPLTQDCTIITNGNNYLKVYLGGQVVVNRNNLNLQMAAPFNSYLEPQTSGGDSMRFGTYTNYYSTFGENVTVTNAPPGGTAKIVDSTNTILASGPVSSTGTATLPVGKYSLPLTANIQVYDSTNTLVASTSSPATIWGGDVYKSGVSTVPSAPTGLTATAVSASQINLSWTAPANNGGSPITGYKVERSTNGGTTWSTVQPNTGSTATTYSDIGLAASTAYTYRVSAINAVGTSSPSNTASATTSSSGTTPGSIVLNGVQTTSGTVSSAPFQVTLSNFNAGTGINRVLVVGVEANNNAVTSITFGGVQLTMKISSFFSNDAEFWYLVNPSGTANIVVTMAGPTSVVVGAYSFSGVDQVNPIPTSAATHSTAAGSPIISITTQFPNSWVLDSPAIWGGNTLSTPTCTQQWNVNVPGAITGASSSTVKATAGLVTCGWTSSGTGDLWDDAAIEVKASG